MACAPVQVPYGAHTRTAQYVYEQDAATTLRAVTVSVDSSLPIVSLTLDGDEPITDTLRPTCLLRSIDFAMRESVVIAIVSCIIPSPAFVPSGIEFFIIR